MKKTVLFSALIALFTIFITPTISYAEDTGEEGWWQDPGTGINYDSYEECVSQNSGYGCDFVGENFIGDIGEDDSGEYDDGNYMCCDLWHDSPYTSYEECAMDCGDPSQCTPGSDWNMACDSENGDGCDPDSRCAQCCIQYGSGFIDEYNVCQSNDLFPPDCESSMFTWEEDGMLYACNSCTDAYALGGTGTDINCNYLKALYYEHTDDDEPSYGYLLTCSDGGEITDAGIRDVCGNNTDCYNTLTNSSLTYAELLCMGGDTDISDDYNKDKLNEILAMADYRYNAGCAPKISGPRCDVMDAVYAHYRNTGDTLTCGYTHENIYQSNYYSICERVIPDADMHYDCHYNIAKNCETYNAALNAVDDDPYGPYRYLQNNNGVTNCKANVVSSCDVLEYLIDAYNDSPDEDYYTLRDTACESMSGSDEGTVNEEEVEICYNNLTRMSYAYEPILEIFEGSDVTLGSFVEELSTGYDYTLNCNDWCPAGQYNKRGMCLDCPKGTYQYDEGMDYCYNCESGSYQDQMGQTGCIDCPSHTALSASGSKITVPATSPQAATKISDCHIAIDHKFRGLHGIYQFNPYCPYSE